MEIVINKTKLSLEKGDITKYSVDAIVNAANSFLMGGGGVDGAIHRVGGRAIALECKRLIAKIGKLSTGKAIITRAGELPAKNVIHTVGPTWKAQSETAPKLLAAAYRNSLRVADDMALRTIAFPSISTGAYGYPVAEAAKVALTAVVDYLKKETIVQHVIIVLFSADDLAIYSQALTELNLKSEM
jgi:O-acetyl-ADP-ribose deacetylase